MALNKGFEYREQIASQASGLTVLDYLSQSYRHSSKADWRCRLENGEIFVDGMRVSAEAVLKAGRELLWRRPPWNEPDVPLGFAVLHEDEHLLAVGKVSGLPTVPAGGFLEHTLLALVRKRIPEATPVHRLGRGTSGVVLFARTRLAASALCAALRRGEIIKVYRALASGTPSHDRFPVDTPIGLVPHPKLGAIYAVCPQGKPALSRVKVIERRSDASLLEVRIETGRPHQIRIHLAAAGHPLVGDPLYAPGGVLKGAALPGEGGYRLHAERLRLRHPQTGKPLEIWCRPPPDLRTKAERESIIDACSRAAGNDNLS